MRQQTDMQTSGDTSEPNPTAAMRTTNQSNSNKRTVISSDNHHTTKQTDSQAKRRASTAAAAQPIRSKRRSGVVTTATNNNQTTTTTTSLSASPQTAATTKTDSTDSRGQEEEEKKVEQIVCAACSKPIKERYLLEALDKQWHEDCLKCECCECRLGEVGSSLFTQADKILCRRDFLRIFGQPGSCSACREPIPPYELVMRANENVYHMQCFACQKCQHRFCVGDRFHLTDLHKIICTFCHSEQQSPPPAQSSPANGNAAPATPTPPTTTTSEMAARNEAGPTAVT